VNALSVIIPALDSADTLACALDAVDGVPTLVVDGGSSDGTIAIAEAHRATVVRSPAGRGTQLRTGAECTKAPWLLFLHADTVLERGWRAEVEKFMTEHVNGGRAAVFRFALDDASPQARRLERLVRWRGRVLALPYGDQGLLIHTSLYHAIGGFRPLAIMEDVDIIRRIGRARLHFLDSRASTSALRWQIEGWTRRSARNLLCLAFYFAGLPPRAIARVYGP
jgi:rSAM/selenodomain-associated transferase 2